LAYLQPRKRTWCQQLWLVSSAAECLFEAENCHPHHCLANSRTVQDLASTFPGFFSTKVIFQDFPGPGNFQIKISGLFSRRENPDVNQSNQSNQKCPYLRERHNKGTEQKYMEKKK